MQILTFLLIAFTLLSPVFFWMYLLQSFPHLWVWRKQFFIGIIAGAMMTLPLVYNDIWVMGGVLDSIFFSFSYISESFFGLEILMRLSLFFGIIFISWAGFLYFKNKNIHKSYISACIGFILLIAICSVVMYIVYSLLWSSAHGETLSIWDYIFQGFALIFWYYMIISILEEGLKYFWNTQVLIGNMNNFYKIIWFACASGLGFSFFENILYAYSFYMNSSWLSGVFQPIFFRSIFTVSLHILCAILLASGLYIFSKHALKTKYMYLALFSLSWWALLAHALFNTAMTYWYVWVIFLYIFALYICVVYVTAEWWAENKM